MNCGNLGEEYGRRDFPGDINNFHCLTKHSAKRSDHDREKNKYILLMVKQIQYLMYPCNCCNFLTIIYIAAFVFEFCNSTLTH